jgi:hypothetical protein
MGPRAACTIPIAGRAAVRLTPPPAARALAPTAAAKPPRRWRAATAARAAASPRARMPAPLELLQGPRNTEGSLVLHTPTRATRVGALSACRRSILRDRAVRPFHRLVSAERSWFRARHRNRPKRHDVIRRARSKAHCGAARAGSPGERPFLRPGSSVRGVAIGCLIDTASLRRRPIPLARQDRSRVDAAAGALAESGSGRRGALAVSVLA